MWGVEVSRWWCWDSQIRADGQGGHMWCVWCVISSSTWTVYMMLQSCWVVGIHAGKDGRGWGKQGRGWQAARQSGEQTTSSSSITTTIALASRGSNKGGCPCEPGGDIGWGQLGPWGAVPAGQGLLCTHPGVHPLSCWACCVPPCMLTRLCVGPLPIAALDLHHWAPT